MLLPIMLSHEREGEREREISGSGCYGDEIEKGVAVTRHGETSIREKEKVLGLEKREERLGER